MHLSQIITIESFLTPAECESFIETIEAIGFSTQHSGEGQPIRSRAQFEHQTISDTIWERLRPSLPKLSEVYADQLIPEPKPKAPLESYVPHGLNNRFRCYKYGAKEEFRRHQDFAHEFTDTERTFLTVLLYLNDGYIGGETTFDDFTVEPTLGMLAMFPHELQHEGRKIESGIKYSLRTDVIYTSNGGL